MGAELTAKGLRRGAQRRPHSPTQKRKWYRLRPRHDTVTQAPGAQATARFVPFFRRGGRARAPGRRRTRAARGTCGGRVALSRLPGCPQWCSPGRVRPAARRLAREEGPGPRLPQAGGHVKCRFSISSAPRTASSLRPASFSGSSSLGTCSRHAARRRKRRHVVRCEGSCAPPSGGARRGGGYTLRSIVSRMRYAAPRPFPEQECYLHQ